MKARYYSRHLSSECRQFKCEDCQKHKADGRGWGLLPEREVTAEPFEEVAVDLIGPWKIPVGNRTVEFNALTCIDMASNLVELVRIKNKTSSHVSHKFAQTWLARYPRCEKVIHDNGGEFIGPEFQSVLRAYEIRSANTSSKNPQANAVCERMHQTVANILRTLLSDTKPKNVTHANEIIDEALALAMFALRATIHTTLGSSPGSLAFNRDMLLNIPLVADWHMITKRREHLINKNLRRENRKRRRYDYEVGEKVLKRVHDPTKLGQRTTGPYKIEQVHTNGTVVLELRPGITERINIRRIKPYRLTEA